MIKKLIDTQKQYLETVFNEIVKANRIGINFHWHDLIFC